MKKVMLSLVLIIALATAGFAGGQQEGQTVPGQKEMADETYAMVVFLKGSTASSTNLAREGVI